MKYLLLNSLKAGGAERVAQTMSEFGIFDGIIILEKDQDYAVKIPVHCVSGHDFKTSSFLKTLFIPVYSWRIKKIISSKDIVVSFAERSNFANIFLKFFVKHKAVLTLHTNLSRTFLNKKKIIYFLLIKMLYRLADAIVSVSSGISYDFSNILKYTGISKVIYNPIDIIKINESKNKRNFFDEVLNDKCLITVGRLSYEKAQWNLLKIFSEIIKKGINTKLVILGDGELRGKLISYSRKLGLKTFLIFESESVSSDYHVYFLGYQENPYSFLNKATVFVLTSVFEGLPMVILEAMACGLPIVSSDCDYGPREILRQDEKKYGILLPILNKKFLQNIGDINKNEGEWANTITSLLNDEEKLGYFSQLSKERAEEFSASKIKREWVNLFDILEKK